MLAAMSDRTATRSARKAADAATARASTASHAGHPAIGTAVYRHRASIAPFEDTHQTTAISGHPSNERDTAALAGSWSWRMILVNPGCRMPLGRLQAAARCTTKGVDMKHAFTVFAVLTFGLLHTASGATLKARRG
jgi:hypothetical protein